MSFTPEQRAFLDRLMATPGPAGFEAPAQHVVRDYLASRLPKSASVRLDRNDNLIATVRQGSKPRVALLAHVDAVGLMVSRIDSRGALRVASVGNPRAEALVSQLVVVHAKSGPITGVVFRADDGEKKAEVGDLAIDCGFADPAKASALVRPGDYVTWAAAPRELADGRLAGPATDDRVGVFVICQTLLAVAPAAGDAGPEVSAVSCIQEEGPTHLGAITTMSGLKPDLIVIVDTTSAGDIAGGSNGFKLGGGPLIARGGSVHNRTSDALLALAESMAIPFQIEPVSRGSGTDLEAALQFAGGDAVGCLVSIPHRHYHTPNEVFDPADVELTIRLLTKFLAQPTQLS